MMAASHFTSELIAARFFFFFLNAIKSSSQQLCEACQEAVFQKDDVF